MGTDCPVSSEFLQLVRFFGISLAVSKHLPMAQELDSNDRPIGHPGEGLLDGQCHPARVEPM